MTRKVKDVVYTREYTKNGETQKQYINCGAILEGDNGQFLVINSIPTDKDFSGFFGLYDPRDKDQQQKPQAKNSKQQDDDLPW